MSSLFESLARQALGLPPEIAPVPRRSAGADPAANGYELLSPGTDLSWNEMHGAQLPLQRAAAPAEPHPDAPLEQFARGLAREANTSGTPTAPSSAGDSRQAPPSASAQREHLPTAETPRVTAAERRASEPADAERVAPLNPPAAPSASGACTTRPPEEPTALPPAAMPVSASTAPLPIETSKSPTPVSANAGSNREGESREPAGVVASSASRTARTTASPLDPGQEAPSDRPNSTKSPGASEFPASDRNAEGSTHINPIRSSAQASVREGREALEEGAEEHPGHAEASAALAEPPVREPLPTPPEFESASTIAPIDPQQETSLLLRSRENESSPPAQVSPQGRAAAAPDATIQHAILSTATQGPVDTVSASNAEKVSPPEFRLIGDRNAAQRLVEEPAPVVQRKTRSADSRIAANRAEITEHTTTRSTDKTPRNKLTIQPAASTIRGKTAVAEESTPLVELTIWEVDSIEPSGVADPGASGQKKDGLTRVTGAEPEAQSLRPTREDPRTSAGIEPPGVFAHTGPQTTVSKEDSSQRTAFPPTAVIRPLNKDATSTGAGEADAADAGGLPALLITPDRSRADEKTAPAIEPASSLVVQRTMEGREDRSEATARTPPLLAGKRTAAVVSSTSLESPEAEARAHVVALRALPGETGAGNSVAGTADAPLVASPAATGIHRAGATAADSVLANSSAEAPEASAKPHSVFTAEAGSRPVMAAPEASVTVTDTVPARSVLEESSVRTVEPLTATRHGVDARAAEAITASPSGGAAPPGVDSRIDVTTSNAASAGAQPTLQRRTSHDSPPSFPASAASVDPASTAAPGSAENFSSIRPESLISATDTPESLAPAQEAALGEPHRAASTMTPSSALKSTAIDHQDPGERASAAPSRQAGLASATPSIEAGSPIRPHTPEPDTPRKPPASVEAPRAVEQIEISGALEDRARVDPLRSEGTYRRTTGTEPLRTGALRTQPGGLGEKSPASLQRNAPEARRGSAVRATTTTDSPVAAIQDMFETAHDPATARALEPSSGTGAAFLLEPAAALSVYSPLSWSAQSAGMLAAERNPTPHIPAPRVAPTESTAPGTMGHRPVSTSSIIPADRNTAASAVPSSGEMTRPERRSLASAATENASIAESKTTAHAQIKLEHESPVPSASTTLRTGMSRNTALEWNTIPPAISAVSALPVPAPRAAQDRTRSLSPALPQTPHAGVGNATAFEGMPEPWERRTATEILLHPTDPPEPHAASTPPGVSRNVKRKAPRPEPDGPRQGRPVAAAPVRRESGERPPRTAPSVPIAPPIAPTQLTRRIKADPEAPPLRIDIGHIEIGNLRPDAARTSRKHPTRPSARLSLAQYLAQRSGTR